MGRDIIPSIRKQTPWETEFFDFGKAQQPNVRFFNTSIFRRPDGLWLISRRAEGFDLTKMGENRLMAFKLDDEMKPTHFIPIQLSTRSYKDQHFEDPRITLIGGQPWLSYCTFQIFRNEMYSGAHQQVAILTEDFQPATRWDPVYGNNGGSILTNDGNEKNWIWFDHGSPHMIYMSEPHEVVRWDGDNVAEVYKTKSPSWEFGHIRGGAPPIRVGDEYLCFFHSSTMWTEKKRRYHMGAYTFEAKPPFRVTRMTQKPLLSGSKEDPWAEGLPLVVFPCGSLMERNKCVVTMGVNDYCSAWIKIPLDELEPLMECLPTR